MIGAGGAVCARACATATRGWRRHIVLLGAADKKRGDSGNQKQ